MLFKKKEEQITNSTQIKEILDKSDISTKVEMNIMNYIYDLEEKDKEIERYKKRIKRYKDKIKDLELKNSILEYNRDKSIRTLETLKSSARWERHLYEIDYLIVILRGKDNETN